MASNLPSMDILFFTRHKAKVQVIVAEVKRLREVEATRKKECLRLMEELNSMKSQQREHRREAASKHPEDITFVKESYENTLQKKDKKIEELQAQNEDLKRINQENQDATQSQSMQIYELNQIIKEQKSKKQTENASATFDQQHRLMNLFESKYNAVKHKLEEAYLKLSEIERDRNHVKDIHATLQRELKQLGALLDDRNNHMVLYEKQLDSYKREQAEDKKENMELKLQLERCKTALSSTQSKWKSALQETEKLLGERSQLLASLIAMESEKQLLHSQIAQEEGMIDILRLENLQLSKKIEESMKEKRHSTATTTASFSNQIETDVPSPHFEVKNVSEESSKDESIGPLSQPCRPNNKELQMPEITDKLPTLHPNESTPIPGRGSVIQQTSSIDMEKNETDQPSLSVGHLVGNQRRLSTDSSGDAANTLGHQRRLSTDCFADAENTLRNQKRMSADTVVDVGNTLGHQRRFSTNYSADLVTSLTNRIRLLTDKDHTIQDVSLKLENEENIEILSRPSVVSFDSTASEASHIESNEEISLPSTALDENHLCKYSFDKVALPVTASESLVGASECKEAANLELNGESSSVKAIRLRESTDSPSPSTPSERLKRQEISGDSHISSPANAVGETSVQLTNANFNEEDEFANMSVKEAFDVFCSD